jgi:CysZ protein
VPPAGDGTSTDVLSHVAHGAADALAGARFLLARPRLWIWVALPALLSLVILVAIVAWFVGFIGAPLRGLVEFVPGGWAETLLQVIVGIVSAALSLSVFLSLAALIAAPFNEMLSESVEAIVTGRPSERFGFFRFLRDLAVGMIHAARRVAVYLIVVALLFLASWLVPVIGAAVAAVLGFIATARFASYDAYDAVWSRRRWRYADKTTYLRQRRFRTLGLGSAVAVLLIVPGLNLVALSVGATAATLAFLEEERARAAISSIRASS